MNAPSPRPTRVVLTEALAELADREARLAKLGAELAETRKAISALRKLVEGYATPLRATDSRYAVTDERPHKPGELMAAAIEAIRSSFDPLSREQVAEKIGRNGRGLATALTVAVRNGHLVIIDDDGEDRYGMASPLAPKPEEQMLANGDA